MGAKPSSSAPPAEDEIIESDVELEGDIVEPDNDPPQMMGDPSVRVTVESRDASQRAKGRAMQDISEGNFEAAIVHSTVAILLNPTSAIMYGTRATVYIKMKKPNAAVRDANAALEINPDSAKGYKARGMARAMLGQWGEAAKDLHLASTLDYDEEISAVLKKVERNVHRLDRRLYREIEDWMNGLESDRARAQAEREQSSSSSRPGGMPGGFPGGGFPGGGFPGGMPRDFHRGFDRDFPRGMHGGMHGGIPGDFHGGIPGGMHGGFRDIPGDCRAMPGGGCRDMPGGGCRGMGGL